MARPSPSPTTTFSANGESATKPFTALSARSVATIVSEPTNIGSSAATSPRNTYSESRKRIGNATISALARSSLTRLLSCAVARAAPPTSTSGGRSTRSAMRSAASWRSDSFAFSK